MVKLYLVGEYCKFRPGSELIFCVDDQLRPEDLRVAGLELHRHLVRLPAVHLHPQLLLGLEAEQFLNYFHLWSFVFQI